MYRMYTSSMDEVCGMTFFWQYKFVSCEKAGGGFQLSEATIASLQISGSVFVCFMFLGFKGVASFSTFRKRVPLGAKERGCWLAACL